MVDTFQNPGMYNAPPGSPSTVGPQIRVDLYYRKALVEAQKEAYFGQMANVRSMPKHHGKTIKQYHYLPILDARNTSDQGIDAQGIGTLTPTAPALVKTVVKYAAPTASGGMDYYFEAVDTTLALAKEVLDGKVLAFAIHHGFADTAAMVTGGWVKADIAVAGDAVANRGNLYGSSKDVGTIQSKIPTLTENGGRVNRVGMTRILIEGTLGKFGFFEEYTQESMDFDTDAGLLGHITTESVKAANEMTEAQLQLELLNAAGVVRFTGDAASTATLNGASAAAIATTKPDVVSYDDLIKLSIELDNNRTPKKTEIITGSRNIDTKVVNAARYLYIGSELVPTLMRMKDYHNEKAYLPVAQYGAAGTIARGEVAAIGDFRIIVHPEMMHWDAAGADVVDTADELCYWSTDNTGTAKVNVYPMLVVGDASFATIGFQSNGSSHKFKISHKKPGIDMVSRLDPYGETGIYSIKWYFGFMPLRPERIALVKTVAEV